MRVHVAMWWALKKVARSLREELQTAAITAFACICSVAVALIHCAGLVIAPLLAPFMQLWRRSQDRQKFSKLLGIARGWGSNRSLMAAMLEQRLQLFPNDRPYRVLLAVIQHKDSLRRRIQLARLRGEHGGRRRG